MNHDDDDRPDPHRNDRRVVAHALLHAGIRGPHHARLMSLMKSAPNEPAPEPECKPQDEQDG